jgi:hypothetical protein
LAFGEHLDQFLFSIQQVVSDEFHVGAGRRVIETQNDFLRWFIKTGSRGQVLGGFALYFQESRSLGDETYHRARMLVSSGLLARRESYLTDVNGCKCFRSEKDIQERLADDRVLHDFSMCAPLCWSQN